MRSGEYSFEAMSDGEAREIAAWRYAPPYDFYDTPNDADGFAELLDPRRREDSHFSVRDGEGVLVGIFQFEEEGGTVNVGLGLRPDLTGKNLGLDFLMAGLDFARQRFDPDGFTLSVATFNGRAIRVYEHAGFRPAKTYMHHTNGGEHRFLSMVREA